jgi:hypothetical protein
LDVTIEKKAIMHRKIHMQSKQPVTFSYPSPSTASGGPETACPPSSCLIETPSEIGEDSEPRSILLAKFFEAIAFQ